MAVDDLWYLRKRGPAGKPIRSKRYGRGRRWRVRYTDPETGKPREPLFEKKSDAEHFDTNTRADISRGVYVDPRAGRITVAEYAKQWRAQQLHRDSTAERVERAIRLHIEPALGHLRLSQVRSSHIRGWVKNRRGELAASTLAIVYHGILVPIFTTAVIDRLIGVTPCTGVRLPEIDDAKYTIATPGQVHALYEKLPERYRAIAYVAAGCGLRGGEVFGLEFEGVDFLRREVTVRQQLKAVTGRKPFLAPPKTKTSKRTVELPQVVSEALARHIEQHPPAEVEVDDDTDSRNPARRVARLLFTNASGEPIHRASWSRYWGPARDAAGLPAGYGVRDLRHYFATVLIHGGANVKTVQLAMGHTTPTITLNTYLGYWPDALDRTRSLVDAALGGSAATAAEAR